MKALILGLGLSGEGARKFLEKKGYTVICVDDRKFPREIQDIETFDLFVPSPGIPRTHPLYLRAVQANIPIKGECQLAFEKIKQPCIGVTGTNGKSTVVKMIAHCLNASGKKAIAVGNVGDPLIEHIDYEGILVIELSSFQLETIQTKVLDVALILNIEEDHLDRYECFDEYAKTKAHMQNCLKEGGKLFIHSSVNPLLFSHPFIPFEGGNEEAAWQACAIFGMERGAFIKALSTFEKPPHRLEFVMKKEGVTYFNDSKATNIAAVINALEQVGGKVVLIAGGFDKKFSFAPLARFKDKFSSVIAFGQTREKIANALQHLVEVKSVETLYEAAHIAMREAKSGETVLFSPGCSSFDAFTNYAARGDAFKRYVMEVK